MSGNAEHLAVVLSAYNYNARPDSMEVRLYRNEADDGWVACVCWRGTTRAIERGGRPLMAYGATCAEALDKLGKRCSEP